jgi:hypothetical protein
MAALRVARYAGFSDQRRACHITSMSERRLKRSRDPAQRAKLIVDIATGQVEISD